MESNQSRMEPLDSDMYAQTEVLVSLAISTKRIADTLALIERHLRILSKSVQDIADDYPNHQ